MSIGYLRKQTEHEPESRAVSRISPRSLLQFLFEFLSSSLSDGLWPERVDPISPFFPRLPLVRYIIEIIKKSRTAITRWWLLPSSMLPRGSKQAVLPHVPHLHSRQEEDLTNELMAHIGSIFSSSSGKHILKDLLWLITWNPKTNH